MNSDKLTILDHIRGILFRYRWGWIGRKWRKILRDIDRKILFPKLDNSAKMCHIYLDSAWRHRNEWKQEPESYSFKEWCIKLAQQMKEEK